MKHSGLSFFSLPMDHPERLHYREGPCSGPCFYRTALVAPAAAEDTFLDTTPIQKGFAWLNGIPLGRAWSVGPQASLFIPGSWLKPGKNSLVVFELQTEKPLALQTTDHALWIPGKDEPKK